MGVNIKNVLKGDALLTSAMFVQVHGICQMMGLRDGGESQFISHVQSELGAACLKRTAEVMGGGGLIWL